MTKELEINFSLKFFNAKVRGIESGSTEDVRNHILRSFSRGNIGTFINNDARTLLSERHNT